MSIDPQTLRSQRFEDVGQLLERDAAVLVDRWCARAVREQPTAHRVHHDILRDDLVDLVWKLGHSLSSTNGNGVHHLRIAVEHGEQRWHAGWSLSEVVQDYQIMRLVILEYLDEALERSLSPHESMAVGLAIDEAISASVSMYVQFSEEGLRTVEQQLREQTQALKDADRRKDEFLATLAHELRNPLSPILHAVEVLALVGPEDSGIRQTCNVVERQVKHISRLVDDLLDLTRISQGKIELRKTWSDLAVIVAQAIQTSGPLIKSRNHQLSVNLPTEPLGLEVDPARLVQIVANLLTNAAKYTPAGGQIWLTGERKADHVVISVRDNGVGISAEMIDQVFDMFRQVDASVTRSHGGLGIGLTLVRSLVLLHGGDVTVHSDGLEQGSEFVVRLPIGNGAPANKDAPAGVALQTSRRILIVEDSSDTRDLLRELLQLCGHQIEVAESGVAALQVMESWTPEIALVDIGLPGMSGYELAKTIRSAVSSPIKLIALTGYGQPTDRQQAIEAGFDAHLIKPVKLDDLAALLAAR